MSVNSSSSQLSHLKNFQQQMAKLKSPFIEKIKSTTQNFHIKTEAFRQKLNIKQKEHSSQRQQLKQKFELKYHSKQLDTEENIYEKQNQEATLIVQQISPSKNHIKNKGSQLPLNLMKEWAGSNKFAFTNIEEVKEDFINVFNKKLSIKKKRNKDKIYDFREDQKNMLSNIFHQIEDTYGTNKGFASINKIVEFFRQNELFYLFYNLHPNRLKYVLKDFARTKPDLLSQKQFLHVFFMDRPLLKDLSDPYQKIVHRKCVLDAEGWEQMKNIFNTLDTFGNETIPIYPFFKKLKTCHSNPSLIFTPVIEFPEIKRIYTLKKVVFDLEHKFKFNDKVQWKDIENLILNFNHKEEPTLDVIFQKHLQKASIFFDSNYFLIDKKVIDLLKNIFEKCPKFSEFFVNTKFIGNEILQSQQLKGYYKNLVRQKNNITRGYLNFEEATRFMTAKAPQYIDLDEFLEYFSIKGPVTNIMLEDPSEIESSDDENQSHDEKTKLLRRIRSLQKLQQSRKAKKVKRAPRQITDFKQFKLTKKQKETIREKKLKQLLHQKQQEELNQLKNKFKANPIPADLNPERLKEQQKKNQMRKKKKLEQVAKRRQQQKEILSYLKANTKLFQPLNKDNMQESSQKKLSLKLNPKSFTHKPVPWFVQDNLLYRIEKEKSQRKRKIYEEAKLKYARSWNQLPDFFFKDQQNQNSSENSIVKELRKENHTQSKVMIKANPVPDFKALQKQFEEKLEKKKKMFNPTQVQQFRFTSPKISKRDTQSHYLSPQIKREKREDWHTILHSPPANKITTTKKTEQWMEHNKRVEQQKRAVREQQKLKQKQRVSKQRNFAKFMSRKLRQQQRYMPDLEGQTADKLKKHRQKVKYLSRETQKQLSQIYARVLQRPFLFEIDNTYNQSKKQQKFKKGIKGGNKIVVKNIEPIDMSEQSTNKYNQFYGKNNHNKVYEEDNGDQEEEKSQTDSNYQSSRQQGLNQSF